VVLEADGRPIRLGYAGSIVGYFDSREAIVAYSHLYTASVQPEACAAAAMGQAHQPYVEPDPNHLLCIQAGPARKCTSPRGLYRDVPILVAPASKAFSASSFSAPCKSTTTCPECMRCTDSPSMAEARQYMPLARVQPEFGQRDAFAVVFALISSGHHSPCIPLLILRPLSDLYRWYAYLSQTR
jgi:hypothetical protein